MTYGDNDPRITRDPDRMPPEPLSADRRRRASADNTGGWILAAVVGAAVILGAIYWVGSRNTNTANTGNAPAQTTGTGPTSPSGAPSKGTTGSGSPSR